MSLVLSKVAVILPVAIGQLSQARRQRLATLLKEPYPLTSDQEDGTVAYVGTSQGDLLVVEPTRLAFIRNLETGVQPPPLEQWSALFSTICAELLLDAPPEFGVNFHAFVPAQDSSMDGSVQWLSSLPELRSVVPNLKGVGLRLLLQDDPGAGVNGEFKAEPFIADPSKFFFELTTATPYPRTSEAAFTWVGEQLERFRTLVGSFREALVR